MNLPLTSEEFVAIYSKVPRLTVEVIVVTDQGIVLTKRSIAPYEGSWHIPGGTVYMNESLEEAVQRVALDELGVTVAIDKLVGHIIYPSIKDQKEGGIGWPIGAAFLTHITDGDLRGSRQGEEVKTFSALPDDMIIEQKNFIIENAIL